jgi:glycerate 2-kinase
MIQWKDRRYADLEAIFRAGLLAVDPYSLVQARLSVQGRALTVSSGPSIDLAAYDRLLVIGAGKATAAMAQAVEDILGERISDGVIVIKEGHTASLRRVRQVEAGHPVPDARGQAGAEAVEALARSADERTLVIGLISGGGSALLPAPFAQAGFGISLEEKRRTTQALLACGATIQEFNCIRKHISRLKGGRLAALLYPATTLNLILSDVVGDRLDTIASGLTVPDETTFAEALAVVGKYSLQGVLPGAVTRLLQAGAAGEISETPKPGDPVFSRVRNVLLGTNRAALEAAAARAGQLGYEPLVLSSRITGESREVARVYAGIALEAGSGFFLVRPPCCILGGGETTVTIRGTGKGGRNQELALSFLSELAGAGEAAEGVFFLSAATDGSDGPTDAAGAFASREIATEALTRGLEPGAFLAANDAYGFFSRLGALLKTGPTGTNVCDLQLCIVGKNSGEGT